METTTPHQTNGKSLIHVSPSMLQPQAPQESSKKISRVLELVGMAIDLELKLKATMAELETEAITLGRDGLPGVFASMFRVPRAEAVVEAKGPGLAKTVPPTWVEENTLKGRIITLMKDERERKSSVIIKSLKAKNIKSSVYHALKELVTDGFLVKPAYGFYRKA